MLAVTHAPQVAARAGCHLHISKGALVKALNKEESVVTRVTTLDEMERREEIARMLSGAAITDEARAAAAQLIKIPNELLFLAEIFKHELASK